MTSSEATSSTPQPDACLRGKLKKGMRDVSKVPSSIKWLVEFGIEKPISQVSDVFAANGTLVDTVISAASATTPASKTPTPGSTPTGTW